MVSQYSSTRVHVHVHVCTRVACYVHVYRYSSKYGLEWTHTRTCVHTLGTLPLDVYTRVHNVHCRTITGSACMGVECGVHKTAAGGTVQGNNFARRCGARVPGGPECTLSTTYTCTASMCVLQDCGTRVLKYSINSTRVQVYIQTSPSMQNTGTEYMCTAVQVRTRVVHVHSKVHGVAGYSALTLHTPRHFILVDQ